MADATMKATSKVTQDGKTHVIKVRVQNGSHLGKIQVSGANEQDARNNLEALLQVARSKTEVTYA
jgi:phosphotransferase system HPr-like phosphotransfer protein